MTELKMRYCFYCGCELGRYKDYDPLDTCGKLECERETRKVVREEDYDEHRPEEF